MFYRGKPVIMSNNILKEKKNVSRVSNNQFAKLPLIYPAFQIPSIWVEVLASYPVHIVWCGFSLSFFNFKQCSRICLSLSPIMCT